MFDCGDHGVVFDKSDCYAVELCSSAVNAILHKYDSQQSTSNIVTLVLGAWNRSSMVKRN